MRQKQGERQHAEDRQPDDELAPVTVADRPAGVGSRGDGAEEDEQHHLRGLHGNIERLDEIEGVVALQAREVEHLRKDQDHQDDHGAHHLGARQRGRARRGGLALGAVGGVPLGDAGQDENGGEGEHGERQHRTLAERHDDEGRHQRPQRLAEIAADLEQALREAVAPAGGRARRARGLGVKNRAADADHRHRRQQQRVIPAERQRHQAGQRERHRRGQGVGHRAAVGEEADERLQQRGGELKGEGDQPGLEERQRQLIAKHRIERRGERLHHVVEHMRAAGGEQHAVGGRARGADGRSRSDFLDAHAGGVPGKGQGEFSRRGALRGRNAPTIFPSAAGLAAPRLESGRSTHCDEGLEGGAI